MENSPHRAEVEKVDVVQRSVSWRLAFVLRQNKCHQSHTSYLTLSKAPAVAATKYERAHDSDK